MINIIKFGEEVKGYSIPVLNEREIRAAAGILFLAMLISLVLILSGGNFVPIKYMITLFLTDFIIRVFINPKFAPTLIVGRWIVRNQTPEYVGAKQKKFAWIIGIVLASIMFIHMVVINAFSPITGIICLICLIFLFFESAFGICLGCKFYSMIYKEKAQYCPGEICEVKDRHEIQKISLNQWLIVLGLAAYMLVVGLLFDENFRMMPYDIFGIEDTSQQK
ncbi:MAG: hypothetical protein FD143_1953 [Ignavibacteria bacterium]|nr:MAG: hypothetical protein FD143_1953 [Ignavibacteria bacterium]KAF0159893.1 MAG: hypothetical protein FD188_2018 [Ignavibacteria bacterium]